MAAVDSHSSVPTPSTAAPPFSFSSPGSDWGDRPARFLRRQTQPAQQSAGSWAESVQQQQQEKRMYVKLAPLVPSSRHTFYASKMAETLPPIHKSSKSTSSIEATQKQTSQSFYLDPNRAPDRPNGTLLAHKRMTDYERKFGNSTQRDVLCPLGTRRRHQFKDHHNLADSSLHRNPLLEGLTANAPLRPEFLHYDPINAFNSRLEHGVAKRTNRIHLAHIHDPVPATYARSAFHVLTNSPLDSEKYQKLVMNETDAALRKARFKRFALNERLVGARNASEPNRFARSVSGRLAGEHHFHRFEKLHNDNIITHATASDQWLPPAPASRLWETYTALPQAAATGKAL